MGYINNSVIVPILLCSLASLGAFIPFYWIFHRHPYVPTIVAWVCAICVMPVAFSLFPPLIPLFVPMILVNIFGASFWAYSASIDRNNPAVLMFWAYTALFPIQVICIAICVLIFSMSPSPWQAHVFAFIGPAFLVPNIVCVVGTLWREYRQV